MSPLFFLPNLAFAPSFAKTYASIKALKYASVILRRYVEETGNADGVYVIRDGERIPYADLVKEVEVKANDELEAGQPV